jgi:hypothetical protein
MTLGKLLQWAVVASLLVSVALAVVTLGVVAEGERALTASDKAFDQGDVEAALAHAQRAATLYAPGAPHRSAAYERIIAIAVGSERQQNPALALRAWRALRGVVLETRHLWLVEPGLLALANDNLARLQAQELAVEVAGANAEQAQHSARAILERDEAPRAVWVVVLGVGFLLTVLGLSWAIGVGVTKQGVVVWERLRWPAMAATAGLIFWILAVYRA